MARHLLIHSFGAALLISCALFHQAFAIVAVGEAGVQTNQGLTIETSARHLATIFFDGQCMNISCSYTPTGNSLDVQELSLNMYNSASHSYNIPIDKVSAAQPTPLNDKNNFAAAGEFSKKTPILRTAATGQDICQFARFRCEVKFVDDSFIFVDSNDRLPFARNTTVSAQAATDQWLERVKAFVVEQLSLISRKMVNKLFFLEIKVDEILVAFQKMMLPRLKGNLKRMNNMLGSSTKVSSQTIQQNTNYLKEEAYAGINALTDQIKAALEQLNLDMNKDISSIDQSLQRDITTKNSELVQKVIKMDEDILDRVKGVETDTREVSSRLEKRVGALGTNISTSLNTMQNDIVTSIDSLEDDINKSTKSTGDDHKKETGDMKTRFKDEFGSMKTFIDEQIKRVDETSTDMRKSLTSHIKESLKNVRETQQKEIRTDITNAVETLRTTLEKKASKVDERLSYQVDTLGRSVDSTATILSTRLTNLDERITSLIENFQQSIENEVNVLHKKVNDGMVHLTRIVNTNVEALGSNIGQTTDNLQSQINTVGQITGDRLENLRNVTLNKVDLFDEKITQVLNVTRNNIVQNVIKLSNTLTEKAQNSDSGVSTNIDDLNKGTKQKIGEVSNVLLGIINDITQQQMNRIEKLSLQFSELLRGVSNKLNVSRGQANLNLKDSSSEVQTDIESLKETLLETVLDSRNSMRGETEKLQNESTTAIKTLADKVVKKIEEILSSTSREVSSVLGDFDNRADGVETTNDKIDAKLSILITQAIEAVQNDTKMLDNNFIARADAFIAVKEKLVEIDRNFKELGDSNAKSFDNVEKAMRRTSKDHSNEIKKIDEDLAKLEKVRKRGQKRSDDRVEIISHDLNTTSVEIVKGLNQSFNQVDDMLDWSSSTLKEYLRPETCRKGMGFLSSSRLTYVVIPRSQEMDYEFLCDAHTDGGGWIVIQKRENGDTDFYRTFADYEDGFGTIYHDFWLGLEKIHELTSKNDYELRVDMIYQGANRFAQYSQFTIGDASTDFKMTLGGYSGTAGDSMSDTDGMKFSTKDRDNDQNRYKNCAKESIGGWWYNNCQHSNLNGYWGTTGEMGVRWAELNNVLPLTRTEIKIRLRETGV